VPSFSEEGFMAIFISALATACLLLLQGIHILKTGDIRMFFLTSKSQDYPNSIRFTRRLAGSLIYGAPACAIFALLIFAVMKNGRHAMISRIATNSGNFIGGVILFTLALSAIIWPDWYMNGLQAAHPSVDIGRYEGLGRGLLRVIGAFWLLFSLIVLLH
jgi:hypothetical protein